MHKLPSDNWNHGKCRFHADFKAVEFYFRGSVLVDLRLFKHNVLAKITIIRCIRRQYYSTVS